MTRTRHHHHVLRVWNEKLPSKALLDLHRSFKGNMHAVLGRRDHEERRPCRLQLVINRRAPSSHSLNNHHDAERLHKSRKLVDSYLARISCDFGRHLSLNPEGVAYLPFKRFVLVVEVPQDNPSVCFFYSMVYRLTKDDDPLSILQKAMQLNYMQYNTRGGTLGLDGDEINLCFSLPISSLTSAASFHEVVDDFMATTIDLHQQLERCKCER